MTGEQRRERAARHVRAKGRAVKIIANGAVGGVERKYQGTEEGFVTVTAGITHKT